jgi:hypothetical protein
LSLDFSWTPQQLAIRGTEVSFAAFILFLLRDSCCLVIFEFCLISQIFSFVSGYFLYPATVSHQGNCSLHFAFVFGDVVLRFSSFVCNLKYLLLSLDFPEPRCF